MRNHMLKYHVGVPLLVIAVLLVVGLPAASAVRAGIAAGCLSMVLMMFTGHGHGHRHHKSQDAGSTTADLTHRR
jgi:hypothetical protein